MKRTALAIGLFFFTYILVSAFPEISNGRINAYNYPIITSNTCNVKNSNYLLTFKISGMNGTDDAKAIDKFMEKKDFVISSSTSFNDGLCIITTDNPENSGKFREMICSCWKILGHKISAEFVESMEAKD